MNPLLRLLYLCPPFTVPIGLQTFSYVSYPQVWMDWSSYIHCQEAPDSHANHWIVIVIGTGLEVRMDNISSVQVWSGTGWCIQSRLSKFPFSCHVKCGSFFSEFSQVELTVSHVCFHITSFRLFLYYSPYYFLLQFLLLLMIFFFFLCYVKPLCPRFLTHGWCSSICSLLNWLKAVPLASLATFTCSPGSPAWIKDPRRLPYSMHPWFNSS